MAAITIHGTHKSLVSENVVHTSRGAGIYVEDGNEIDNTISYNTITCLSSAECINFKQTGLYAIGMHNSFIGNHVSCYQNTFFSPGGCCGAGFAWGDVCPRHTPFKTFVGQYTHSGGRFGIYFDNQFSRNVTFDEDGRLVNRDRSVCDETLPNGADNGFLSVVDSSVEWHQQFIGQYSLGDFQYRNYTCVNSGTCMYWKQVSGVCLLPLSRKKKR